MQLAIDTSSTAYMLGRLTGALVIAALALGLVVWGVRSLRRTDRGLVRVIIGSLLVALLSAGYMVQIADAINGEDQLRASTRERPEPDPVPDDTAEPTPRPTPDSRPKPGGKFKPKPIPDPGPARYYSDCNDAIDSYNAARFELIKRGRIAWVDGAFAALLTGTRIAVRNERCFEDDIVEFARKITLKRMNEPPPRIKLVPKECQQVYTDAFRLIMLASAIANGSEGKVDLRTGLDVLQGRHPDCLTDKDVNDMKKVLSGEIASDS